MLPSSSHVTVLENKRQTCRAILPLNRPLPRLPKSPRRRLRYLHLAPKAHRLPMSLRLLPRKSLHLLLLKSLPPLLWKSLPPLLLKSLPTLLRKSLPPLLPKSLPTLLRKSLPPLLPKSLHPLLPKSLRQLLPKSLHLLPRKSLRQLPPMSLRLLPPKSLLKSLRLLPRLPLFRYKALSPLPINLTEPNFQERFRSGSKTELLLQITREAQALPLQTSQIPLAFTQAPWLQLRAKACSR